MTPEERLSRYARLAVEVGVNLQPGQLLRVDGHPDHLPLIRADRRGRVRARRALRRDGVCRSARSAVANPARTARTRSTGRRRGRSRSSTSSRARTAPSIAITGDPEPELFADLDPATDRQGAPAAPRRAHRCRRRATGGSPGRSSAIPNPGWAQMVFGEPDVERLWEAVAIATRLDEPDPVAAWRAHIARLQARAALLDERRFDADPLPGPGTDLTVGLMPESRWQTGRRGDGDRRRRGREHADRGGLHDAASAPHRRRRSLDAAARRQRADRSRSDAAVRGRAGRRGERDERRRRRPRGDAQRDDGASFLGEVALVDGESRVGKTGLVFFDTLFDENAACHIAYGQGIPTAVAGHDGSAGRS